MERWAQVEMGISGNGRGGRGVGRGRGGGGAAPTGNGIRLENIPISILPFSPTKQKTVI